MDTDELIKLMFPFSQAWARLQARFEREGPFECAPDDPDGVLCHVAGWKVVYMDGGSIMRGERVAMHDDCDNRGGACSECRNHESPPPTKCPDCGAGVHECSEHEPDRAKSGCLHCDECGWMREPW